MQTVPRPPPCAHAPQRLTQSPGAQPHSRSRGNPSDITAGVQRHPPAQINTPTMLHNPAEFCLVYKKPVPFFFMRRLQGVHSLPEFARKLADAIVCVMNAAAANGGAHFNDFENTASICCDCLSEIAKTCKLGSLNRDCPLAEVRRATLLRVMAIFINITNISRQPQSTITNHHHLRADSFGPRTRDRLR